MFISLAERDDFQQLGQDSDFQNAWKQHGPIKSLINASEFQSLWQNQDTVNLVWGIVQDNFDDLVAYLQTGQTAKYGSEKYCWSLEFQRRREPPPSYSVAPGHFLAGNAGPARGIDQSYAKTAFVAGADGQAFLKNLPHNKTPTTMIPPPGRGNGKLPEPITTCRLTATIESSSCPPKLTVTARG